MENILINLYLFKLILVRFKVNLINKIIKVFRIQFYKNKNLNNGRLYIFKVIFTYLIKLQSIDTIKLN